MSVAIRSPRFNPRACSAPASAPGTAMEIGVAVAMERLVRQPGDDLRIREKPARALEDHG
jgi:hypothetical protein